MPDVPPKAPVKAPESKEPKRSRTFKLIGGPHHDEDGEHIANSPTEIVKSDIDLVAKHGADKFVEVK